MKKLNYLFLPIFFFGFIYFMFFNQKFKWIAVTNNAENRSLAPFPHFNPSQLDKYPGEFDAYLNDNFTFRAPFLNLYHDLKFAMRVSPNKKDVIIGSSDHFFIAQKDQESFEGKHDFTPEKMDSMLHIWNVRDAFLGERNIPYYWLIAPNKHHVYSEYLPFGYREKNGNRIVKLVEQFNKKIPHRIVYPLKAIRQHVAKENAYFKQDNHWSHTGALIAYDELMVNMKREFPELNILDSKSVKWKQVRKENGNLLSFLGKNGQLSESVMEPVFPLSQSVEVEKYDFNPPNGFAYAWDYEHHFKNEKALNKKKVLIIRDSFGAFILPFLNETFSETLYIFDAWKYGINKEIIEKYQPEIIVVLSLETHTDNVLRFPPIIDKE